MLAVGLVKPVRRKGKKGLRMFTVLKREEEVDGETRQVQRLVFDMRKANRTFPRPPRCELSSVEQLASTRLPRGGCVYAYAGDLPDFFYTLRIPPELSERLWLGDLDWDTFVRAAVDAGYDAALFADADGLGFTAPPMGFSWAPLLAQRVLEHLVAAERAGRTYPGDPPVTLEGGSSEAAAPRCVHWEYLDDFGELYVAAERCDARARALAARARLQARLSDAGLRVHKEQLTDSPGILGTWLRGADLRLLPHQERFPLLVKAIEHLLEGAARGQAFRPRDVESLLGRATWYTLLRRELFCCFNRVYEWTRRMRELGEQDRPRRVPTRVQQELRCWLDLSIFLSADLARQWHPVAVMSDAGPEGAGVVAARGRAAQLDAWERDVTGLVRDIDRLLIRHRWRRDASQVEREAVASVLALRQLARSRSCRGVRVLQALDADSVRQGLDKGRSGAPGLITSARRTAAIVLFSDLSISRIWVPSELNLADGPSRGADRPSVAEECVRESRLGVSVR